MLHRPLGVLVWGLALSTTAFNTQAFDFDWDTLGWSSTFSNTYVNVDGSGIDVVVTVNDPLDRTNPTSANPQSGGGERPALFAVSGQNELRIFPDFTDITVTPDQSVTVTFEFFDTGTSQTSPALVSIENLVFRDIDSTSFSDGVILDGFRPNGLDLPPNNVQLGSANIDKVDLKTIQPNSVYTTGYDDPAGWVTAEFSTQAQVSSFTVTHFPAVIDPAIPTPPNNPAAQAITIADFQFFLDAPLTVSKTVTSPVPASPGDNITYTVDITNNRTETQTGIDSGDRSLAGTSYVAGSTTASGTVITTTSVATDDFQSGTFPATGSGWTGNWTVSDGSPTVGSGVLNLGLSGYFFGNPFGSDTDIARVAPVSPGVGDDVLLSFDLSAVTALQGTDTLTVYASSTGGAPWTALASYSPPLPAQTQTVDITAFAGPTTGIRFVAASVPTTFVATRTIGLDNVDIEIVATSNVVKDDGGGPNPLVGVAQPPMVVPGDNFAIPPGDTLSIAYSMLLSNTEPLPLAVLNVARGASQQYPTPLFSAALAPVNLACPGPDGASTIPVIESADDGWWDGDSGRARFGDQDVWLGSNRGGNTWAGFRFQGITIPDGAEITQAYLEYESDKNDSQGSPAAVIYAVDSADAPAFGTSPPVNLTDATVDYTAGDFGGWTTGTRYQSPDISAVIQELVDDNGGLSQAAIAVVLEATGDSERRPLAFDGLSGNDLLTRAPTLTIAYSCASEDRGDAPSGYGDPRHTVSATPLVFLGGPGDEPDVESTTPFSVGADGDDTDGNDDENGVTFAWVPGPTPTLQATVTVTNNTGSDVTVCAWLDRPPANGFFDLTSGFCTLTPGGTQNFTWASLPDDQAYTTYLRARVTSDPLTALDWSSAAGDGEVEDYRVTLDFSPTATTIGRIDLVSTPVEQLLAQLGAPDMQSADLQRLTSAWLPHAGHLEGASREAQLAALVDYLDPDGDGGVAVMRWDTLEERGTIGFYVERRSAGDAWQRVNTQLLPGLISAPMGGEYQLADPGVRPGVTYEYRLIELEARGTTREYGPFTLRAQ